jgi:hypothetical protein
LLNLAEDAVVVEIDRIVFNCTCLAKEVKASIDEPCSTNSSDSQPGDPLLHKITGRPKDVERNNEDIVDQRTREADP